MKIQKGKKYIVWGLEKEKVKVTELYNRKVKVWFLEKNIPYVRYTYKEDDTIYKPYGIILKGVYYNDIPLKKFEKHVIREVK